jgi:hypothetical protein
MNTMKQLISYILVIQLCVSCTGGGKEGGPSVVNTPNKSGGTRGGTSGQTGGTSGNTGEATDGATILIQGQISKVFRNLSDFILPSANAQDGQITAYNMTDPEHPLQIGEPVPVDSEDNGYSIELNAKEVKGAIIKLKYIGRIGARDLLVDVDNLSNGSGDMNEDNHFESGILEEQLRLEGIKDKVQLRKKFVELKNTSKEEGVEKDLALFGDSESMKEILRITDTDTVNQVFRDEMKRLVAMAKDARKKNGVVEDELIQKMIGLAKNFFGKYDSSSNVLNCSGPRATFFIGSGKTYRFSLQGHDLELLRAYQYQETGGSKEFGKASSSDDANKLLRQMSSELEELSIKYEKNNLSGVVIVSDISEDGVLEEDKTCILNDPVEKPDYLFDLKILENIPYSVADTQDDFKKTLLENFDKSREEYSNKIKEMNNVGHLFDIVLKIADAKVQKLIENRVRNYEAAKMEEASRDVDATENN